MNSIQFVIYSNLSQTDTRKSAYQSQFFIFHKYKNLEDKNFVFSVFVISIIQIPVFLPILLTAIS